MNTIDQIANAVHANARRKGFHPKRVQRATLEIFLAEQLLNSICEIAELWESKRNGTIDQLCDKAEKMKAMGLRPLTCREEEYADILIRTLDQCKRQGVNIVEAVSIKHAYNKTRPYRHGNKKS